MQHPPKICNPTANRASQSPQSSWEAKPNTTSQLTSSSKWLILLVLVSVSAIAAMNGFSWVTLFVICNGCIVILATPTKVAQSLQSNATETEVVTENEVATKTEIVTETARNKRLYRLLELNRVKASLLANSSILVTGESGCGKSVLARAIVEGLEESGFKVAFVEPASTKQMLLEIASCLEVNTHSLEGKALNIDQLKRAIATPLEAKKAFLILDDAHSCDIKFRMWLKQLQRSGALMFLLATDPPRSI